MTLESKECILKLRVLNHGVQHLQSCYFPVTQCDFLFNFDTYCFLSGTSKVVRKRTGKA